MSKLNPSIIIMEYNSVFGFERAITIPYRDDFMRAKEHSSNLYFGASLSALNYLANNIGYVLVGCNIAGNNAYFIRKDLINDKVGEIPVKSAFKNSQFREGRKEDYSLSFISGEKRVEAIKGLKVINVSTGQEEKL